MVSQTVLHYKKHRSINRHAALAVPFFLILLMVFISLPGRAQGTGLILPTEEELRSVPLASTPFSGTELPASTDLSADLPPPGHQGMQNSCVGWTLAYAMKSYQEHMEEGHQLANSTGTLDYKYIFSPAFIYNQLNYGRDGGCHIHDALNLLQEKGVCAWKDMPYTADDFKRPPTEQALARAKRYRINTWRQVNIQSTREVKTQVQAGYPVIIGAMIDKGFESFEHPPGWIWKQASGAPSGAHAMLVVGYHDGRRAFKVINSWGTAWGEGGYCWIDYDHFRRVVRVGYVAKDARNGPTQRVETDPRHQQVDTTPFNTGIQFKVTKVNTSTSFPNQPHLGYYLKIDGRLSIPGKAGRTDQVVIHFYQRLPDGRVGHPVPGDMIEYRDINGNASCGTAVYPIPPEGLDTTFSTWISYAAFRLPAGQWVQTRQGPQYQPVRSHLYAIPTLFIDNFGVATGDPIYFAVDK